MAKKLALISNKRYKIKTFLGIKLRFIKIKEIKFKKNNENILCFILPYEIEELKKLTKRRNTKLLKKLIKLIDFQKVTHLILEKDIKVFFQQFEKQVKAKIVKGNKIFCNLIPDIIRRIVTRGNLSVLNLRLGISDSILSNTTEYVIRSLHFITKGFVIYTNNIQKSKILEDKIFKELGLPLEIKPIDKKVWHGSDILIDIDEFKIIIGKDFIIDGVLISDLEIPSFNIDSLDLAAYLNLSSELIKIKELTRGSKTLPI